MDKPRKIKLEAELKRMAGILRAGYFPEKLILFGSMAEGRTEENSDIDLLIIKQTNKKFTDRIGDVLRICRPRMAADFIVYTPREFSDLKETNDFVRREIIEKGKVIYERRRKK
jgi:predicted nucleotidyltransferase